MVWHLRVDAVEFDTGGPVPCVIDEAAWTRVIERPWSPWRRWELEAMQPARMLDRDERDERDEYVNARQDEFEQQFRGVDPRGLVFASWEDLHRDTERFSVVLPFPAEPHWIVAPR